MSNAQLVGAIRDDLHGPNYPEEIIPRFQEAYKETRYGHKPIKLPFLKFFSEDFLLKLLFGAITFDENFVTKDGTKWIAIGFRYKARTDYVFAFPTRRDRHHEDGTVSGHSVAVFCSKRKPDEEEMRQVSLAILRLFEDTREDFDFKHHRD
ncbi:MAG: hypothetical protein ABIT47_04420 [Candidatus Paceibacterota bacterium]